jgi:hypothetical protein
MDGMREALREFADVDPISMIGVRAPQLAVGGIDNE